MINQCLVLSDIASAGWTVQLLGPNLKADSTASAITDNLSIFSLNQGFYEALTGLGAVIFLISDGCIGINMFYYKLDYAQEIIMSTYYLAQFLMILSGAKIVAQEKGNKTE